MKCRVGMKIAFLFAINLCIACSLFCTACSDKEKYIALDRTSLKAETWLEVEKNETVKICLDSKVHTWETSLDNEVLNDSCLKIQIPTLIGVYPINVQFYDTDSAYKINLVVGMKYLDFKNEEVLLGFHRPKENYIDEEKLVSVTATYLVDKYPVTNCEMVHFLREGIFSNSAKNNENEKHIESDRKCDAHDYATRAYLYQALKYANARSVRDGLKPYYVFSPTNEKTIQILSEGHYIIEYEDFAHPKESRVEVSIDSSSDGYRLPFYDEWMMFARGGDKKNDAPWGDSATQEDVLKYAKFEVKSVYEEKDRLKTGNVGLLLANGYGLYDMFGLVEEHVLLKRPNQFKRKWSLVLVHYRWDSHINVGCKAKCPSYLKGGDIRDRWQNVNYGYYSRESIGGFRLVRNIGNNVKWTEVKSESK